MAITAAKLLVWVGADTRDSDKALARVSRQLQDFGKGLSRAGQALSLGITTPAALAMGAITNLSMSMEQSKIAFTTMLRSGEKAAAFLESLRDFAAKTPFEFMELQDAARRMLAFGFAAERVLPMLTDIGDAAAGLGMGAEGVDRVTLALGQMQAKSKVSAQEMMQLTEAGIPAWRYLAQSMGLSTAEAMKLSEKGLVPAGEAIEAILAGMRQDFGGMMAAQSQTAAGQLSNLKDELVALGTELGDILLPTVKDLIAASREAIEMFSGMSSESKKGLITIALGLMAIGPALAVVGKLVVVGGALIGVIQGIAVAWKAWTAGMTLTTALGAAGLSPIAISLGAIALAVGSLIGVWAAWNKNIVQTNKVGKEAVKTAWTDFFKKQVEAGKSAADVLKEYEQAQARVNNELKKAGILKIFIKDQEQLKADLPGLNMALVQTSQTYAEYTEVVRQSGQAIVPFSLAEWEAARATIELQNSMTATGPAAQTFGAVMSDTSQRVIAAAEASRQASDANRFALKQAFEEIVAGAQTTKESLTGLIGQYDDLKSKMDAWVQGTASEVVNMLGDRFSEASQKYRDALAEVDDLMGTNYIKQLETTDAVKGLVDEYAKTGNLESFREGLKRIKEEGLADMQEQLMEVTQKAQDLYDKLLALPKEIQIKIDFVAGELPNWVTSQTPTSRVVGDRGTPLVVPEAKAEGGSVQSYRPYVVGERGPELFIPDRGGKIVPNRDLLRTAPVINISATVNSDIDIYKLAQRVATEIQRSKL